LISLREVTKRFRAPPMISALVGRGFIVTAAHARPK